MNRERTVVAALLIGLAGLVGCDKKVQISFVNGTSESRDIQLSTPDRPGTYLGTAGAMGGRVGTKLQFKKHDLPAHCQWKAGDQDGRFTITEDTPDKLWIHIDATGTIGPVDKNAEIDKTRKVEIENIPIEQDTVVE